MNSTSDELSDVRLFKYARKFHNVLFHPCYPDGKKHNEKEKKSSLFSRKREHKILSTIRIIILNQQPYGTSHSDTSQKMQSVNSAATLNKPLAKINL